MAGEADTVTVSKAEHDTLVRIREMMNKTWDNKDTGAQFRKLLKQTNPDLKIPDDLAESAIAPVKTFLRQRDQVAWPLKILSELLSPDEVLANWKAIKSTERVQRSRDVAAREKAAKARRRKAR